MTTQPQPTPANRATASMQIHPQPAYFQLPIPLPEIITAPPLTAPDAANTNELCYSPAQPFIKWAGGKRALTAQVNAAAPTSINAYWEPFLGGGAVFFSRHHTAPAHLSDINAELVNLYVVVQRFPESLIHELMQHAELHQADPQHFYRVRQQHYHTNPIAAAARTVYLNKTCYNGLYRVNAKGHFNVGKGSYRYPTICDADGIMAASIAHRDFSRIQPEHDDFVYCDPPHHGTYTGYTARKFSDAAQTRLRDLCRQWHRQGAQVMVSNADTPFIRELYQGEPFRISEVSAPRHISAKGSTRGRVNELMITTYAINQPAFTPTPEQPVII